MDISQVIFAALGWSVLVALLCVVVLFGGLLLAARVAKKTSRPLNGLAVMVVTCLVACALFVVLIGFVVRSAAELGAL